MDLAPVSNPDLLANMVAHALEVPERAVASSGDALIEWLKPRDVLLILDNCEHLVDPCAALARRCCATRRGFASSQQLAKRLGCRGEGVADPVTGFTARLPTAARSRKPARS